MNESVEVFYTGSLTEEHKKNIELGIYREFGDVTSITYIHDTSLIGGFVIKKGDSIIDASVKELLSSYIQHE